MTNGRRIFTAGVAAALAMDLAQATITAVFERNREPDDLDEETEAVASVVKRLAPLVPGSLADRYPETCGRFVHYAFGSVFALAYDVMKRRAPIVTLGRGTAFGIALWLISDVVLVPAIKFGRPWNAYSNAERLNALVSHVAYATVLDRLLGNE